MATANTKRKTDAGQLNDLYETPLEALELFYEAYPFPVDANYLEPCDGLGQISGFLQDKGLHVITNELYRDIYNSEATYEENFLTTDLFDGDENYKPNIDIVVMNPPFKGSLEFILKALDVADTVVVFGRASLLEGKKRKELLWDKGWLKEVYMHSSRVGCRKGVLDEEGNVTWEKANNAVFYCWYVLSKSNKQPPVVRWL